MLNFALRYLKFGFSIIPLKPRSKEPLVNWSEFQRRCPIEAEVRKWWSAAPNANIGIVTGSVSKLAVIDLDGPAGLASAQRLGLKSSVVSLTGNGKHLWYKMTGVDVGNAVRSFPGIDVRGEGGYVVAPPSLHESGRRYRWATVLNAASLPPFPEQILAKSAEAVSQTKIFKDKGWVSKALQEMTDGNIDATLFTICARLRADGYSPDDARVLLAPHAERVGAEDGHLDEKIQNVWNRYEPRKPESTSGLHMVKSELIIHSPTNSDSWEQFNNAIVSRAKYELGRLQTGYPKLDQMLHSGLKSSRLFTLAARTGVGKTNWLIGTAKHLCQSGKRVLLFSTEMPYTQIWDRYIQTLNDSSEFRSHQFFVCDSFAPNIERVEEAINEIKPDVFMFDHINHVSEEQRELGSFMQGLNFLRRKYECAGIVTAQLNRSADWIDLKTGEKVTPRMSMIKGSGTIEQASSRVLLLSETRVTPEGIEIVGNLDKNDDGPKGLIHFMLQSNPYKMIEL